jgi:hypothetical protein
MGSPDTPEPSPEPSDKEILGSMTRDFGWQIQGPFYTEAPQPKPEYILHQEDSAERLRHHLLDTVIIHDQFGDDHHARRKFLTEHNLGGIIKKFSKLKGNNQLGAIYAMGFILDNPRLKRDYQAVYQKLLSIFTPSEWPASNPPKYNKLSYDEKVTSARQMDDAIYRFLQVLAE